MTAKSRNYDAYGQLMWDYHITGSAQEIIERDDGWIGLSGGAAAYFRPYREWGAYEKKAMRLVRGRVLDVGCGAGRNALYLQEKGFDVMGIDISPLAIKVAKERGLKQARVIKFSQLSPRLGTFGTVLMMGSNFGLFANLRQARIMLRRLHRMTTPDARIIAESADPYDTTSPFHLEYHKQNRKKGRFSCQLFIRVRYQKLTGDWFEYLKVSRDEMKTILEGTGWRLAKTIPQTGTVYVGIIEKC